MEKVNPVHTTLVQNVYTPAHYEQKHQRYSNKNVNGVMDFFPISCCESNGILLGQAEGGGGGEGRESRPTGSDGRGRPEKPQEFRERSLNGTIQVKLREDFLMNVP